ncbi:uncharacterized protein LOC143148701 isoform X1 [Ptiloglossa arizonensis]|uniref:uncharacterized protein LOC143148701 isoform X1 n=1 Tax=Ptiloglossa arizonensis TaxID=3350558 RepID=UPI003F9F4B97
MLLRPSYGSFFLYSTISEARRLLRDAYIVFSSVSFSVVPAVRSRGRSARFREAPCTPCTIVVRTALRGPVQITPTVDRTGIILKTGWYVCILRARSGNVSLMNRHLSEQWTGVSSKSSVNNRIFSESINPDEF